MTASLFVRSILHLVIERAIEVYRAASGFGSFVRRLVLWWRRQKGTFTGERSEGGEGAPLINRRDAIRAAAAELLPFDLPSPTSSRSLACSAAGMKGNEPPLRIHFRKMDQPWRDARSIHRSLAREQRGTDGRDAVKNDRRTGARLAGWLAASAAGAVVLG